MKIEIVELTHALNHLAKVAPARHAMLPVLETVLLESAPGGLRLSASNLDEALSVLIPATGEADNLAIRCCVALRPLQKTLRLLPKAELVELTHWPEIVTDGGAVLRITGGDGCTCELDAMDSDEFPAMLKPEWHTTTWPVHTDTLLDACRTAACAISHDDTRYVLNGLYWHGEKGKVVATDGRRAMIATADALPADLAAIVPATKTLLAAKPCITGAGTLSAHAETAEHAPLFLTLRAGAWQYTVKLFDGVFPNYECVIPAIEPAEFGGFRMEIDVVMPMRA